MYQVSHSEGNVLNIFSRHHVTQIYIKISQTLTLTYGNIVGFKWGDKVKTKSHYYVLCKERKKAIYIKIRCFFLTVLYQQWNNMAISHPCYNVIDVVFSLECKDLPDLLKTFLVAVVFL